MGVEWREKAGEEDGELCSGGREVVGSRHLNDFSINVQGYSNNLLLLGNKKSKSVSSPNQKYILKETGSGFCQKAKRPIWSIWRSSNRDEEALSIFGQPLIWGRK